MRFTGERVIPDRPELLPMMQEHEIRYEFARNYIKGADVLDLGCGCGYGTHILATQGARSAVGVDIDREAIAYSQQRYQAPNLRYEVMDITNLAYPDQQFTAVVCLEVLEHVADPEKLLAEAFRVLKPGGTLVLSTPNKQVWSPNRAEPINPWHVREFSDEEFTALLQPHVVELERWIQTTNIPGIIPFILANLRLQRYYVRRDTKLSRFVERTHTLLMNIATLPPRLIPGAMDKNPNVILRQDEVPTHKHYYFVGVGRKGGVATGAGK